MPPKTLDQELGPCYISRMRTPYWNAGGKEKIKATIDAKLAEISRYKPGTGMLFISVTESYNKDWNDWLQVVMSYPNAGYCSTITAHHGENYRCYACLIPVNGGKKPPAPPPAKKLAPRW